MGIGDLRYRCHRYRESYRFSFRCSTDPAKRLFKIFVGLLCRCDCEQKKELQSVSKYVVADAYFSKETFISKLCNHGFEVVTRLRDDADLRYKYLGEKKKGRGRPQKYDGKVDYKQDRKSTRLGKECR